MADEKAEQAALGNLIRQKRQARGLSQEQLAQQLEVSRQAVAKWESGKGFPSAERLLYLGQVLDIPAEALLGRAEEKEAGQGTPAALPTGCWRREWLHSGSDSESCAVSAGDVQWTGLCCGHLSICPFSIWCFGALR